MRINSRLRVITKPPSPAPSTLVACKLTTTGVSPTLIESKIGSYPDHADQLAIAGDHEAAFACAEHFSGMQTHDHRGFTYFHRIESRSGIDDDRNTCPRVKGIPLLNVD